MSQSLKPIDNAKIENAIRDLLDAIGEDVNREGLRDTPARVARMYSELLGGMRENPEIHFKSVFTEEYDEIVLLRDIPFFSMCEHHMLPFIGSAHVAYLPSGKVLGVSKMARIVDCFAKRLQVQERMTGEIADLMMNHLKPLGVAVVVEASHSCMTIRGIKKPGATMVTSALRGLFRKDSRSRNEILSLLHQDRR
ncbi:MAG: GTP cyclohydrolase I FolE [Phycisphaerae bacterium]|nr:GTP cyclohydrolase I FolE [Phycisphaerae bacterium]